MLIGQFARFQPSTKHLIVVKTKSFVYSGFKPACIRKLPNSFSIMVLLNLHVCSWDKSKLNRHDEKTLTKLAKSNKNIQKTRV